MNQNTKFQSLEATRGLAAIIVVIHHSHFLYGEPSLFIYNGALFVDYFFILSGFIMATAYQHKIGLTIKFKSYFLLRFGRLFPLHLFMLLIWIPFVLVKLYAYNSGIGGTNPTETCNLSSFISNLFLIHSLGFYSFESWNFPSWSISVEFYTYLVFFIYVMLIKNKQRFILPLIIAISCYSILCYLAPNGVLTRTYDYGMIRCLAGFFTGVALYSFYTNKKFIIKNNITSSIIEIGSIALIVVVVSNSYRSIINEIFAFILFAFSLYLFASQDNGIISRILKTPPFQFIGRLSFSIYMVHAIIVVGIHNVFEKLLGFTTSEIILNKGEHLNVIITKWAFVINTSEILIVIVISYFTYKYIEVPYRDKFRTYAKIK